MDAAAVGNGGGCFDGTFAANVSDGTLKWRDDCLGATEAVEVIGAWLYKGSHARTAAAMAASPSCVPTPTAAAAASSSLPQDVTDGQQLLVGGGFTQVNKVGQQGFARFQPSPDTTRPTRPAFLTPIMTWSLRSTIWQTPSVSWEATGLAPGSPHF